MDAITLLSAVLTAIGDVSTLRPLEVGPDVPGGLLAVAIGVALVASVSTTLGHVVVFVINHVRGARLALCMGLGAVFLVFLQLVSGLAMALVAVVVVGGSVTPGAIVLAALLAMAPQSLGLLVFIPYLGLGIGRVLEGWALMCRATVLVVLLDVAAWQAAVVAGVSWLLTQVLSRVLARPLAAATSRVWTLATGRTAFLTSHDILSGAPFVPLGPRVAQVTRVRP